MCQASDLYSCDLAFLYLVQINDLAEHNDRRFVALPLPFIQLIVITEVFFATTFRSDKKSAHASKMCS